MDHQQFLGETVAEIAGEKAGILKRNCTAIVGPQCDEALDVIESVADRIGAPLKVHGQHWHVWEEHGRLVYQDESGLLDLPMPVLIGAHQVQNAGIALAALRQLGKPDQAMEAAMTQVVWPCPIAEIASGTAC